FATLASAPVPVGSLPAAQVAAVPVAATLGLPTKPVPARPMAKRPAKFPLLLVLGVGGSVFVLAVLLIAWGRKDRGDQAKGDPLAANHSQPAVVTPQPRPEPVPPMPDPEPEMPDPDVKP